MQFLYKERVVQSSDVPRNPCLELSSVAPAEARCNALELAGSTQGQETSLRSG